MKIKRKPYFVSTPGRPVVREWTSSFILYQWKLFVKTQNAVGELQRQGFLHQNQCHLNSLNTVIDLLKATYCSKVSQYLLSFGHDFLWLNISPNVTSGATWPNRLEEFLRFDICGLLMWQLLVIDEFTEGFPFSDRDMTLLAPPHVYSLPLFTCVLAAYLLVISHSLFWGKRTGSR